MYIAMIEDTVVAKADTKEKIFDLLKPVCMKNVNTKYLIYKSFAKMCGEPQIVYEEIQK